MGKFLHKLENYEFSTNSVRIGMDLKTTECMNLIEQCCSGIPQLLENCKTTGVRELELLEIGEGFA